MAQSYSILAQELLKFDGSTIYTVPADTQTIIRMCYVASIADSDTYHVFLNTTDVAEVEHMIIPGVYVTQADYDPLAVYWTLDTGDYIFMNTTDGDDNLNVTLFGVEIT